MTVTYFRQRRKGPETAIEDAVAAAACELFSGEHAGFWIAGSPTLGAGMPDLAVVVFRGQPSELEALTGAGAQVLAYLRTVRRASADRIAARLCVDEASVQVTLGDLTDRKIVGCVAGSYRLEAAWRQPLREVVSVEVKVNDWRRAVAQAGRNRVFSNRSFIALPEAVALRVRREREFRLLGIGIIGVSDDGAARIVRPARRQTPSVWAYHYELVGLAAEHTMGPPNAVSGSAAVSAERFSTVHSCSLADTE